VNWYLAVLKNYTGFSGRASRAEYWQFAMVNFIVSSALSALSAALKTPLPSLIYVVAVLVPGLAVAVRRLHDTGRSGWWLLLGIVPIIGTIVVFVWLCLDSEDGRNRYGTNPKATASGVPAEASHGLH
jgi:uncharacterized membrane protein YhaH (DUF805 family)